MYCTQFIIQLYEYINHVYIYASKVNNQLQRPYNILLLYEIINYNVIKQRRTTQHQRYHLSLGWTAHGDIPI